MNDLTQLLAAAAAGDAQASEQVLPLVYAELRALARSKMAREQPGHTLQPTALVHEAWLRLGGGDADAAQAFKSRAHFFGAASEAMRRILIECARRKLAARRGGSQEHVDLDEIDIAAPTDKNEELLAIHEALDRLAAHDPRKAELVKLRYFAGFSIEDAAGILGVSEPTAKRDWTYARAWLLAEISRM